MIKNLDPARDVVSSLSVVNETIVVGGPIFTGTAAGTTIKKFSHWVSGSASGSFYHALYSGHHTGSTSVELVDVGFGYSHSSSYYSASINAGEPGINVIEKNRLYKLYAKELLGDESLFFSVDGSSKHELIFLSVRRSQFKDELKKDTNSLVMMFSGGGMAAGGVANSTYNTQVYSDNGASGKYTRTSRGDYASLKTGSTVVGLVYYQAGVFVLVPELVTVTSSVDTNVGNTWSGALDYNALVTTGNMDSMIDSVRYRFQNLSFVNQSNLHTTFYFCRLLNDEFNYSSNPTFTDTDKRIIPTSGTTALTTRTYVTKVGLVGENGELLGAAALSQPIKKTPDIEFTIKVRLDF